MILSVGGLMAGMHVCDRERERGHVTKSHNNAAFSSLCDFFSYYRIVPRKLF